MTDIVDKETRSRVMSRIRGKNTKPEMVIRSGFHRLGYRFRLHYRKLPGRPDIVLPGHNVIFLVNGCFWHGHDCDLFRLPSTRTEFWRKKIDDTRKRDKRNIAEYRKKGWRVLVIWECAIRGKSEAELNLVLEKCCKWIESSVKYKQIKGKSS